MELAARLESLASDVEFIALASGDLDREVPTCPGWAVRDLLTHTGEVYRWCARVLCGDQAGYPEQWPAVPDSQLIDWFRASHAELAATLTDAPADLECWTFWPVEDPVAFWARRMTNETAIHRVDAQLADGRPTPVPTAVAADGIDELLTGLLAMRRKGARVDAPVTLAIVPDDSAPWLVTVSAESISSARDAAGPADASVAGTSSALFTWLWNRGGDVRFDGDPAVAEMWKWIRVRLA